MNWTLNFMIYILLSVYLIDIEIRLLTEAKRVFDLIHRHRKTILRAENCARSMAAKKNIQYTYLYLRHWYELDAHGLQATKESMLVTMARIVDGYCAREKMGDYVPYLQYQSNERFGPMLPNWVGRVDRRSS